MKKKILLATAILLTLVLAGMATWILSSGPKLPPGADEAIAQALAAPLPDFILGDTGHVFSSGVKIWYESIPPDDSLRGTILLFNGIGTDALSFPDSFIRAFTHAGFRVARFDYRGTGNSDRMKGWMPQRPYTLRDLAADALVILDTLHIPEADLVGISMGGMVAQEFAINFPGRTRTLTSIMSSGYVDDPALPPVSRDKETEIFRMSLRFSILKTETSTIKFFLSTRLLMMGNSAGTVDIRRFAQHALFDLRKRNGFNIKASVQHLAAIRSSGSRYPELRLLALPVLVIHGTNDPLIPIAHGRKCARIIPCADSLWVQEMGHDLSLKFIPAITGKIIGFIETKGRP